MLKVFCPFPLRSAIDPFGMLMRNIKDKPRACIPMRIIIIIDILLIVTLVILVV